MPADSRGGLYRRMGHYGLRHIVRRHMGDRPVRWQSGALAPKRRAWAGPPLEEPSSRQEEERPSGRRTLRRRHGVVPDPYNSFRE